MAAEPTDELHFLTRRLVLWFSKVQFLKRLADRVDYYERSEVCMFSFAKQGNGFRARPVGGAGDGVD